jgi:hypothetical protein
MVGRFIGKITHFSHSTRMKNIHHSGRAMQKECASEKETDQLWKDRSGASLAKWNQDQQENLSEWMRLSSAGRLGVSMSRSFVVQ